jgi:hypothetical protein
VDSPVRAAAAPWRRAAEPRAEVVLQAPDRGRQVDLDIADAHVAQVDISIRPVVADNDIRQAGVAVHE